MFGHYRLLERLGAGGVGEVWRAHDTRLERVVALKTLLAHFQDEPDAVARFEREARMAAGLQHPHVVRVHSSGEIDGRLYLDMELIEGPNLGTVLQAGLPERARALRIIEQVASALDFAHAVDGPPARRMVHRDVKPANVLLEPGRHGRAEHVYLADFGVARAVQAGMSITATGAVNGTPDYMAPELWRGERGDHRVDVYSLAVMLFEMVTGSRPFPRPTVAAIITAHLWEPPPLASSLGAPTTALDMVVARGMAKEPDDRFPSAGALAAAARAALDTHDASPPTLIGRAPGPGDSGAGATPIPTARFRTPTAPGPLPPRPPQTGPAPGLLPTGPSPGQLPTGPSPRPPQTGPAHGPSPTGSAPHSGPTDRPGRIGPHARPPRAAPESAERTEPPGRPASEDDGPTVATPLEPHRSVAETPQPRAPLIDSRVLFGGLAGTALLIPLAVFRLVSLDGSVLLFFVLLYVLGAAVTFALTSRR